MNTLYKVMDRLYSAGKDNMSATDLRDVGDTLSEIAEGHSNAMRDVVEGIACLVSCDEESGAGSFRDPAGVYALLGAISCQFDLLAGMIRVSSEAQWKAAELDRQAGKGGDHGA